LELDAERAAAALTAIATFVEQQWQPAVERDIAAIAAVADPWELMRLIDPSSKQEARSEEEEGCSSWVAACCVLVELVESALHSVSHSAECKTSS
jgi:hypothetical protein